MKNQIERQIANHMEIGITCQFTGSRAFYLFGVSQ